MQLHLLYFIFVISNFLRQLSLLILQLYNLFLLFFNYTRVVRNLLGPLIDLGLDLVQILSALVVTVFFEERLTHDFIKVGLQAVTLSPGSFDPFLYFFNHRRRGLQHTLFSFELSRLFVGLL